MLKIDLRDVTGSVLSGGRVSKVSASAPGVTVPGPDAGCGGSRSADRRASGGGQAVRRPADVSTSSWVPRRGTGADASGANTCGYIGEGLVNVLDIPYGDVKQTDPRHPAPRSPGGRDEHEHPEQHGAARLHEAWKDKQRYLWLIGLVVPSLAFMALGLYAATDWGVWLWLGPVVILGIVPAIDLMVGLDGSNPPDDAIEALENDKYYRWITYAFLPVQYAGSLAPLILAGNTPFGIEPLGWVDGGPARPIGAIGGIGINTARGSATSARPTSAGWPRSRSRRSSTATSTSSTTVATVRGPPRGPASSRLGETYAFGAHRGRLLTSAWSLEKKRYARRRPTPSTSATTSSTRG